MDITRDSIATFLNTANGVDIANWKDPSLSQKPCMTSLKWMRRDVQKFFQR